MAETFTLYKLIVLYMLDRVDFPLTTSQISEFILDKGYTTYFRLQSALAELTDSGLLKIELTHNRTLYNLTEEGANRGKRNSSLNLPYVAEKLAEIKKCTPEEIVRATEENARRLYRLP